VADLVEAMRPHARLRSNDRALLRALVACANHQTASTHREIFGYVKNAATSGISMDMLLGKKESDSGGTLGEVTDGLGDSFVFPLREAMDVSPEVAPNPPRRRWLEAVAIAYDQGLLSNRWYLAWFFWMEVLWLNARIQKQTATKWDLICQTDAETIRQIGMWRRQKRIESFGSQIAGLNLVKVASITKTLGCQLTGDRFLLTARSTLPGEPPWAVRIQEHALLPQYLWSRRILDVDLFIDGVTVKLRDAIAFYSTLMSLFFECLHLLPARSLARQVHLRDSFRVGTSNLAHAISELTDISHQSASTLLSVSTFSGRPKQTLWGRPFVFAGQGESYIFLAALKSSLLRTINDLIDKYAGDNGRKGVFFQEHCRDQISFAADSGPLAKITWVSTRPIQTRAGDIDICVLVGNILLVIEVKFVPVVSDAHEFWRVDRTLTEAAGQLRKKLDFVFSDPGSFLREIHTRYGAPVLDELADVIPLIVSSDAYHAGFPIDGINVADLPILVVFFDNAFVEMQEVRPDGIKERTAVIYRDAPDAISKLKSYLFEPEIIKRLRRQIVPRELPYRTNLMVGGEEELTVTLKSVEVMAAERSES
jgi:hypothetical protein